MKIIVNKLKGKSKIYCLIESMERGRGDTERLGLPKSMNSLFGRIREKSEKRWVVEQIYSPKKFYAHGCGPRDGP